MKDRFAIWGHEAGKPNDVELIDECNTRKEAEELLTEYRLAFHGWALHITDNGWIEGADLEIQRP